MTRSRWLLLLFTLLLLAVYYAWQMTPRQQRIAGQSPGKAPPAIALNNPVVSSSGMLDFSGGEKIPFKPPKRDLFRALYEPPKPPPRSIVPPRPPPPPPSRIITPPPVAVTPPPMGPKPIPNLKVLGYLQKEGSMTVFLSSLRGEVYVLKQGQRFAEDLLVRQLTADKIVVSRGQSDPGLTLPLGGVKPQRIKVVATPSNRPNVPTPQELDVNTLVPENAADKKPQAPDPGVNPADNVNQADQ